QGRYQDALSAAQKGLELSGQSNAALAQLAHVFGRLSRRDEAGTIVKDLERRFENKQADARDIADVYSGLGDKDKAFQWLEKGLEYRSFNMAGLRLAPLLVP